MIAALATCVFVLWLYQKLAAEEAAAQAVERAPDEPEPVTSRLAAIERRVRAASASLGGTNR